MNQFVIIFQEIKSTLWNILLVGLFLAVVSFIFLLVHEKRFNVETDFLIVHNLIGTQDYYSLSKSAEYSGNVLSEALYSELFIDEVIRTHKVQNDFLPFNKRDRLDEWKKIVDVSRNHDTGILSVSVFHNNSKTAIDISESIIDVFTTKNYLFRGNKQDIDIRVLSGPIVKNNPSGIQIAMLTIFSFTLGCSLMIFRIIWKYRYLFDE